MNAEDNAETKGGGTHPSPRGGGGVGSARGGGAFHRDGAMETFASGQLRRALRRIYGDVGGRNVIRRAKIKLFGAARRGGEGGG